MQKGAGLGSQNLATFLSEGWTGRNNWVVRNGDSQHQLTLTNWVKGDIRMTVRKRVWCQKVGVFSKIKMGRKWKIQGTKENKRYYLKP